VVISYQRFGTNYRSHIQGSGIQRDQGIFTSEDGTDRLFRNVCKKLPLLVAQ